MTHFSGYIYQTNNQNYPPPSYPHILTNQNGFDSKIELNASVFDQEINKDEAIIKKLKIVLGDQSVFNSLETGQTSVTSQVDKFEKQNFKSPFSKKRKVETFSAFPKRRFERKVGRLAFTSETPSSMKAFVSVISFITAGIFAIYETYKLYGDIKAKEEVKELKKELQTYKDACNPQGNNTIKATYGEAYAFYLFKGLEVAHEIIVLREEHKHWDIFFRIQAIVAGIAGFTGIAMALPTLQLVGFTVCAASIFYLAVKQGIVSYKEWDKLSELEDCLVFAEKAKKDLQKDKSEINQIVDEFSNL